MTQEDFDQEEFIERSERVFEWNEHGVCENEKLITFKCSKKYSVGISIAKGPNQLWSWGISFNGNSEGFAFGCWLQNCKFETEDECFEYALNDAIRRIQARMDSEQYTRIINLLISELTIVPVSNQLTLF
jgi:hypothetical protein